MRSKLILFLVLGVFLISYASAVTTDINVKTLKNVKVLNVVDRNISLGEEGALFSDMKSALFNKKIVLNGFIAGLGGKDITKEQIKKVLLTRKQEKTEWLL